MTPSLASPSLSAALALSALAALACAGPTALAAPADGDNNCLAAPVETTKPSDSKAPFYTTKYDNINVDMILRNERLLKSYIDCLMDRKPCSREGQLLKEIIPEALQNECARCSEKQKQLAGTIMAYLLQYKKAYWDELLCKYDPEGKFREKYEADDSDEDD